MTDKPDDTPALLDYRRFVEQSMAELRIKTAAHDGIWRLGEADWRVDQPAGLIVFSHADGTTITCPVQIVGTYHVGEGTWLWAWDNPSVQEALQTHANLVRAYGQQYGIARLTTAKFECEESDAWEFAALACKLGDAQGAYRGPAGQVMVFMCFGQATVRKAS